MKLRYFIIRRLLLLIPTLLGLTVITFLLLYSLEVTHEGVLISQYYNPRTGNVNQAIAEAKAALGLNLSAPQQYYLFLKRLVSGSWGYFPPHLPMYGGYPVLKGISEALPNTIQLAVLATIVSVLISIPLGTFIGARPNSVSDSGGRVFSLVGYGMPVFFTAIVLQMLFATGGVFFAHTTGFPAGGAYPTQSSYPSWFSQQGVSSPTHIMLLDSLLHGNLVFFGRTFLFAILPVATISFGLLAGLLRFIRSGMVDSLNQEYVKTARAKGVPEGLVIRHHVRRNAMIPAVTIMGLIFASLLGGVVVVEEVFQYPGIGLLTVNSVLNFAVYGVLGTTLFFGLILVITNLIVDVVYALMDPRIRY